MLDRIPFHQRSPLGVVTVVSTLMLLLAACAAPKRDAAADSTAVVPGDSARATTGQPPAATGDSMPNAKPTTTTPPSSAMPNRPNPRRPEPMPNAAQKTTPVTPAPNKLPPKRVILDPVHAPDSAAAARDSFRDLPSDYKAKKPERRRPLPPIKP